MPPPRTCVQTDSFERLGKPSIAYICTKTVNFLLSWRATEHRHLISPFVCSKPSVLLPEMRQVLLQTSPAATKRVCVVHPARRHRNNGYFFTTLHLSAISSWFCDLYFKSIQLSQSHFFLSSDKIGLWHPVLYLRFWSGEQAPTPSLFWCPPKDLVVLAKTLKTGSLCS